MFEPSFQKTNLCVNLFFVALQGRTSGAARDGHMKHERVELRLSWPFPFLLLLSPRAPFDQHPPPLLPSPPFPFLSPSPGWISPPLLLRASISRARCTPRSRKTSPPPPPPKCQWSMESSLCWGKQQMMLITSRTALCECVLCFYFLFTVTSIDQIRLVCVFFF